MSDETKIEQAFRHVMDGRHIVTQQRQLIEREKAAVRNTLSSELLLDQFERTLAIFEQDLRDLSKQK